MHASRPIPSSSSSHIEDRRSDRSDGSLPSDVCVERHDVCFERHDVFFAKSVVFLDSHVVFLDSHANSFAKHVVFFAPHVVCGDDPSLCFYPHDVCLELHDICRLQSAVLGSRSSLFARKSVLNLELHVVRRATNVVRRASDDVSVEENVRLRESNDVGEERAVVSGLMSDVFEVEDVVCREVESMRLDGKRVGGALPRRSEDTDDVRGEADVVEDTERDFHAMPRSSAVCAAGLRGSYLKENGMNSFVWRKRPAAVELRDGVQRLLRGFELAFELSLQHLWGRSHDVG
jgi:hypothetical protein